MSSRSVGPEISRLIELMSKLPGMGPRSARRAVLQLLKKPDQLMSPLARAMTDASEKVTECPICGNFDTLSPCAVCSAPGRDDSLVCVVADVSDLWAMERAGVFRGRYHVLGGCLSALEGIGPEELNLQSLVEKVANGGIKEVILAMSATVDGQTTAHYVADQLHDYDVTVTRLAHGVPVGGELGLLDDGTIAAALSSRS